VLFNVGVDGEIISYGVARVLIGALIVDSFNYSLVIAVYMYGPVFVFCYIQSVLFVHVY